MNVGEEGPGYVLRLASDLENDDLVVAAPKSNNEFDPPDFPQSREPEAEVLLLALASRILGPGGSLPLDKNDKCQVMSTKKSKSRFGLSSKLVYPKSISSKME